jgi:hypothetical protein
LVFVLSGTCYNLKEKWLHFQKCREDPIGHDLQNNWYFMPLYEKRATGASFTMLTEKF